ncbi:PPM1L [Lepeophtheirus salmonis]|uniref:PPM1L n=1 Tax=Lepeophtheirus salmonis TaxID=72036 RepID=A0A7R8HBB6_LEPSM|nr:PPM1L [Lepeophtheirus salmonis]CAF2979070.1 PPM1L [Lepeophtheirus salmonis]
MKARRYKVNIMEQDDLEEQVVYQSLLSNLELLRKLIVYHPTISNCLRPEILLVIALLVFIQSGTVGPAEVSNSQGHIYIHAAQGKRPSMEDRFLTLDVVDPGDSQKFVKVNAVLDGHGGEFAADFVRKYLVEEFTRKLRGLLLLRNFKKSQSFLGTQKAIELLEKSQKHALSKQLLDFIELSETDYRNFSGITQREQGAESTSPLEQTSKSSLTTSEEPVDFGSSLKTSIKNRSSSPDIKKIESQAKCSPSALFKIPKIPFDFTSRKAIHFFRA